MKLYVCYMLTCKSSGDTYIGVTGRNIKIRMYGHKASGRFPNGFDVARLHETESREEVLEYEKLAIARLRPRLNKTKGGEMPPPISQAPSDPFCPKGHWWDTNFRRSPSGGRKRCLMCFEDYKERMRRAWIG